MAYNYNKAGSAFNNIVDGKPVVNKPNTAGNTPAQTYYNTRYGTRAEKVPGSNTTTTTSGANDNGIGSGRLQATNAPAPVNENEIERALGISPQKEFDEAWAYSSKIPSSISSTASNLANIEALAQKKDGLYRTNENYISSITTASALYGVGGMPASYLHNTDPPAIISGKDGVGAYYMKHNISHGQFIVFQPGYIRWDLSASDAAAIAQDLSKLPGTLASLFAGTLTRVEKQLDTYWFDVERACRYAIYMMGIQNIPLTFTLGQSTTANNRSDRVGNNMTKSTTTGSTVSAKMGEFRRKQWAEIGLQFQAAIANKSMGIISNMAEENMQNLGLVPFFVDGHIESSTALSSSTASNPLSEAVQNLVGDTNSVLKTIVGRVGLQGTALGDSALAYFTGTPMMPQVWQNSTFDKSYSIPLRFSSHAGDPVSVFMNVIYPTIKASLLALPLGIGGFQTSPPVLKVFSQGVINTEYGMITGMSINPNLKNTNDLGMPTEVEVVLNLVDLNPFLYKERPGWFRHSVKTSSGFSNFVATLVGANVTTISTSAKRQWEKGMIELESRSSGNAFRENITFGVSNLINRKLGRWDESTHNLGLTVSDTVGRLKGLFGNDKPATNNPLQSANSTNPYNSTSIFKR